MHVAESRRTLCNKNVPSFMAIGTTVIELRKFKEKKKKKNNNMDKMGKICLALIGRGSGI